MLEERRGPSIGGWGSTRAISSAKKLMTRSRRLGDVVGITVPDKQKAVIHAIGPGFRYREISEDQAVEELIKVYQNVLDLFAKSQQKCLMLVPICGGIQAGKLRSKMGDITLRALGEAFAELEETVQQQNVADKHHGAHVRTA